MDITIPQDIRTQLDAGADLAISISGGKDSQAMLSALLRARRENAWTGRVFAIHADLGRMEWDETPAFVEELCERYGIELVVVRRAKGDLVDRMQDRMEQLKGTDRPFWPSSSTRYCTSDLKRDPIDKYLRTLDHVVIAIGIRAEESPARSKKPVCAVRSRITTKSRTAHDWHPIFSWTEAEVWEEIGYTMDELTEIREQCQGPDGEGEALAGFTAHPAYAIGNERLSCALCIMGSRNDLLNGARRHPELLDTLVQMEIESGFTFTQKTSLQELAEEVR